MQLLIALMLVLFPSTYTGYGVHYDPGVMGNVMQYRRSTLAAPRERLRRDPDDYVCWIATSYYPLDTVVDVTTSFVHGTTRVTRNATCLVVDVTRQRDLPIVHRLGIVAEFAHSQAQFFCGALDEPARACRATIRRHYD